MIRVNLNIWGEAAAGIAGFAQSEYAARALKCHTVVRIPTGDPMTSKVF